MKYEYQVVKMNPDYKLGHDENDILFCTDCLAVANSVMNEQEVGYSYGVYQPRTEGYRALRLQKRRDIKGKFSTFENSVN